jgi:hypothetical protein
LCEVGSRRIAVNGCCSGVVVLRREAEDAEDAEDVVALLPRFVIKSCRSLLFESELLRQLWNSEDARFPKLNSELAVKTGNFSCRLAKELSCLNEAPSAKVWWS